MPRMNELFFRLFFAGWEMKRTRQGQVYYENHITKTTSWERPAPVQAVMVQAAPAQAMPTAPMPTSHSHVQPPLPPGEQRAVERAT